MPLPLCIRRVCIRRVRVRASRCAFMLGFSTPDLAMTTRLLAVPQVAQSKYKCLLKLRDRMTMRPVFVDWVEAIHAGPATGPGRPLFLLTVSLILCV